MKLFIRKTALSKFLAGVNDIVDTQSETMKQILMENEKTKAQLFADFKPEYREQAKQMREAFGKK